MTSERRFMLETPVNRDARERLLGEQATKALQKELSERDYYPLLNQCYEVGRTPEPVESVAVVLRKESHPKIDEGEWKCKGHRFTAQPLNAEGLFDKYGVRYTPACEKDWQKAHPGSPDVEDIGDDAIDGELLYGDSYEQD